MPNLTVDFSRDSLYYRANRGDYRNAHLVTSGSHNAALGINHIALLAPSKPTANLICNVIIETVIGRVYGGVFTNKRVEGISLDIHQREYTDANGAKAYASVISLDSAVTAQVLRYVESRMTVEVIVHNNGAGEGQAQYAINHSNKFRISNLHHSNKRNRSSCNSKHRRSSRRNPNLFRQDNLHRLTQTA